jgi:hypothetical protein
MPARSAKVAKVCRRSRSCARARSRPRVVRASSGGRGSCAGRGSRPARRGTGAGCVDVAAGRSIASSAIACSGTARRLASVFVHFKPALGERAADEHNARLAIDIALFERDPLPWTKPGRGGEEHHRPVPRRQVRGDGIELGHDSNGRCSLRRGDGLSTPSFAGFESIIPQSTARASTCRSACVASNR